MSFESLKSYQNISKRKINDLLENLKKVIKTSEIAKYVVFDDFKK